MVIQLLESRHERQRRSAGATMSIILHATLITLAVQATASVARDVPRVIAERLIMAEVKAKEEPPPPEPEPELPRDAVVVPKSQLPAKGFQVLTAPINIPNVLPEVDLSKAITDEADFSGRGVAGGIARGVVGGVVTDKPVAIEPTQAYLVSEVELAARVLPGNVSPRYPELLRETQIEGEVLIQFVVDTSGRAEPGSVRVIRSSHEQFSMAVKEALQRMRFAPAEIGGRKVRMLVQQPYEFHLAGP